MKHVVIERTVEVPEGITASLTPIRGGYQVNIKGPKGELTRAFERLRVHMDLLNEKTFHIQSHFGSKAEASMVGTITGHLKNMIKGVTEGFTYQVQVITSHFPATVEAQKDVIAIKNLYGRRDPILVPFDPSVNVSIKGDLITLTGANIEKVSQTAARLAESTRLRGRRSKDPTVFQDGLYVVYP
ncbi:MAG: 50S ribosomal protein L6 [Candidatus Heimdallarchaeota archaeon]